MAATKRQALWEKGIKVIFPQWLELGVAPPRNGYPFFSHGLVIKLKKSSPPHNERDRETEIRERERERERVEINIYMYICLFVCVM